MWRFRYKNNFKIMIKTFDDFDKTPNNINDIIQECYDICQTTTDDTIKPRIEKIITILSDNFSFESFNDDDDEISSYDEDDLNYDDDDEYLSDEDEEIYFDENDDIIENY